MLKDVCGCLHTIEVTVDIRAKHLISFLWCVWLHYEVAIPQILATETVYTEITVKEAFKMWLREPMSCFFHVLSKHMPSRPERK